jgi:hypothetical protein
MVPGLLPAVMVNVPVVPEVPIVTESLTLDPDEPGPVNTNGMEISDVLGDDSKVTVIADVVSPAYIVSTSVLNVIATKLPIEEET